MVVVEDVVGLHPVVVDLEAEEVEVGDSEVS